MGARENDKLRRHGAVESVGSPTLSFPDTRMTSAVGTTDTCVSIDRCAMSCTIGPGVYRSRRRGRIAESSARVILSTSACYAPDANLKSGDDGGGPHVLVALQGEHRRLYLRIGRAEPFCAPGSGIGVNHRDVHLRRALQAHQGSYLRSGSSAG